MTYFKDVIKTDPNKYELEKERVRNILNTKYKEDDEYRLKRINYQRQYRKLLKQRKEDQNNNEM